MEMLLRILGSRAAMAAFLREHGIIEVEIDGVTVRVGNGADGSALVITGTALSLPAMIGLLMLIGIVVTNAIVLLDLVEQYRERGLPLQQALIEGGRHRVRVVPWRWARPAAAT